MEAKVLDLTCPNCGASIDTSIVNCDYCGRPIVITSFNNLFGLEMQNIMAKKDEYTKQQTQNPNNEEITTSLAMCLLKLNLYQLAHKNFEKVIENDTNNSEVYFWNAISMLGGKRPFLHTKAEIDKMIEYVEAARMKQDNGIYSYFLAYLKYDYYTLKKLNVVPSYKDELKLAANRTSREDIKILAEALKIDSFDENLSI